MQSLKRKTDPEMIAYLEELLEMAKANKLRSLAVAYSDANPNKNGFVRHFINGDLFAMIGIVDCLKSHMKDWHGAINTRALMTDTGTEE